MKRFTFILLFVIIAFVSNAQHRSLNPEVYTLQNGLTVYLNPDPNASTVYGLVVVKAGSRHDPADATGMAHYQEHMLFKGTQELGTINWEKEKVHIANIFNLYDQLAATTDENERKTIQMQINAESVEANKYVVPNELDKLLKSMGSTGLNAFTSTDMTAYFNEFPPSQIEKWLEVYSHRFINPVFRGFQAELEVVYEEYNMYNDMFFMPLFEEFGRNFFKKHPYGQQTTIGTLEHLKNPSLTKMYTFFKTWYVPNNMALIISGNFNSSEVKPMIEDYFGVWKSGLLPKIEQHDEESFNGRELVQVKMSPVKLGVLGFRTVPSGHPDQYALDVMYRILSNSGQTGLLDQLTLDNKILAAQALPLPYKEHGALLLLIVPKILGQSLEDAENLVLTELKKLANGDFSDEMLESIKKEIYVEYVSSLESHMNTCVMLAQSFVNEQPLDQFMAYPDKIMQVRREDIINVAKKYIGDNYLVFFSTMGFPKKVKIDKPGYEPITDNKNVHSEYYHRISDMPTSIVPELQGYHHSVEQFTISNGANFYYCSNPYNDIFTYRIRFYLSEEPNPLTSHAIMAMDLAQTKNMDLSQLKASFANQGVSYSFSISGNTVEVQLNGMENGLPESMNLLSDLLLNTVIDQSKLSVIYEGEKANRKLETADAESIADILYDYVVYGNLSPYLNRPTLKEVKKLKSEDLIHIIKDIIKQPVEFHFTGTRRGLEQSMEYTERYFAGFNGTQATKRYETPKYKPEQNRIIFVHKKNTVQSKIFFYTQGNAYSPKEEAVADMFNSYFGGGFSGLVLKEIREFRSMAYSAGANVGRPLNINSDFSFAGYIGTQADKTFEAIEIFMGLVRNMPEKPEEAEAIREYLFLSQYSKIPGFRSASMRFAADKYLGWDQDPLVYKSQLYEELGFNDISAFYNAHLKNKPIVIMIVADKKRLNPKELSKFGKVEVISSKKLYSK